MYAYAQVIIERPKVLAVPVLALVHEDEKAFYWSYQDGRASKVQVETGVSDGQWIEVTSRNLSQSAAGDAGWAPINGSEQVILGDLSLLSEGAR